MKAQNQTAFIYFFHVCLHLRLSMHSDTSRLRNTEGNKLNGTLTSKLRHAEGNNLTKGKLFSLHSLFVSLFCFSFSVSVQFPSLSASATISRGHTAYMSAAITREDTRPTCRSITSLERTHGLHVSSYHKRPALSLCICDYLCLCAISQQ